MKILIIDDTRSVHAYVKLLLSKSPTIMTMSVYNGQEGIGAYLADNKYDLILLDWEMPVMTGPETLVELMKLRCQVPIMMMTTKNAPSDIVKMLEIGASEYLMKPFTADILFEKIQNITGKGLDHVA